MFPYQLQQIKASVQA